MTTPAKRERRRLAPGTVLDDRFEIAEFLGAGNFGEVYRAKQLIFGHAFRDVALKLFAEGVVTASNAYEVLNDAIIVVGLMEEKHTSEVGSRLVQVYDMGIIRTPAPRAFLSMKLIPGKKTLKAEVYRYRHDGGMPLSLCLRYLREILVPLAWMHGLETPVVHGDLKPDNVMLTDDFQLVLVDFGLAAHMPLGVQGGDIAYNAPEKLLGLNGGQEADVYSVGLIWYELLTGRHPFEGIGAEALRQGDSDGYAQAQLEARRWPYAALKPNIPVDAQKARIVPVSEINSDLRREPHPQLELLLEQCLADDISRRPANARVLLDKIDAYIASGTLPPSDRMVIFGGGADKKPGPVATAVPGKGARSDEMRLADAGSLVARGEPKLESALAMVNSVLSTSPKTIPALLLQTRILMKMPGRLLEAENACSLALQLAPTNPDVYEALADLRAAQAKPSQAAGYRNKAAELRRDPARSR